jgi:hypothetical protein
MCSPVPSLLEELFIKNRNVVDIHIRCLDFRVILFYLSDSEQVGSLGNAFELYSEVPGSNFGWDTEHPD